MKRHVPNLRILAALTALLCASQAFGAPEPGRQSRAAAAAAQYERAQKLQAKLEAQAGGTRSEAQYKAVIHAYRRVADLDPSANVATPSLVAIGRLYEEMGRLFDQHYFQTAVDTYQLLLRQYPRTRRGPEAVYAVARLEQGPLGHPALAHKFLRTLIEKYPSSDQADAARLQLAREAAEMQAGGNSPASAPAESGDETASGVSANKSSKAPKPEKTSASETGAVVGAGGHSGGIEGKHSAKVGVIATGDSPDYTQIMVRLDGPVKFRSARIPHSQRVYFDLSRAWLVHAHGEQLPIDSNFVKAVRMAQNRPHVVRVVLEIAPGTAYFARLVTKPYCLVIDVGKPDVIAATGPRGPATTVETRAEMAPRGRITPPEPMQNGGTSLTRELGLKIGRIVIDAGHGGFDTGSIGPTGVEEKTVCLEVARSLGALIKKRLPGTEVFYTRDSDTFVPLQERTAIANKDKADLFISIHANSSSDDDARGVETYYLNFTTSPEAMRVAARENALSQDSIHQLHDLLQEISLNDKIEESREFAADVDRSLVHQLRLAHVVTHDRGVKKAPFVVLIGAHMPSILAEISFLSNPTDERLLKTARYRERIAVGLFDGIRQYLASLNSLRYNASVKSGGDPR